MCANLRGIAEEDSLFSTESITSYLDCSYAFRDPIILGFLRRNYLASVPYAYVRDLRQPNERENAQKPCVSVPTAPTRSMSQEQARARARLHGP